MLKVLIETTPWQRPIAPEETSNIVALIDDSMAECLKWHCSAGDKVDYDIPIMPISLETASLLEEYVCDIGYSRVLVLTASVLPTVQQKLFDILHPTLRRHAALGMNSEPLECTILTSMSKEAAKALMTVDAKGVSGNDFDTILSEDEDHYLNLQSSLEPALATVHYFPLHTLHILPSVHIRTGELMNADQVGCGILSTLEARAVKPLSLQAVAEKGADISEIDSIADMNGADIPADLRRNLKLLAHELAGAIVFDLGFNPTGAVFAAGTTSSLVGHNILPIVESLVQTRDNYSETSQEASMDYAKNGVQAHNNITHSSTTVSNLNPASLLIIDRTEDLFTPLSSPSSACLGHRIFNTLNSSCIRALQKSNISRVRSHPSEYQPLSCELQLQPLALQRRNFLSRDVVQGDVSNNEKYKSCYQTAAHDAFHRLAQPMSALASIPFCMAPSLHYKEHLDTDIKYITKQPVDEKNSCDTSIPVEADYSVLRSIISGSEEDGKSAICSALKNRIERHGGQMPPTKKRGLGAEVLAYTQALVATVKNGSESTSEGFSPAICTQSMHLISAAYAVIESMQRCSGKQFQAAGHCDWLCAYDVRSAREVEIDKIATRHQSFDACVAHILNHCLIFSSQQDNSAASSNIAIGGPVDLAHILIQLVRLISLFQLRECDISSLTALTDFIFEHMLHQSSPPEIYNLALLKFIEQETVDEIFEYRSLQNKTDESNHVKDQSDPLLQQLRSSIRSNMIRSLQPFYECIQSYCSKRRKFEKKGITAVPIVHERDDKDVNGKVVPIPDLLGGARTVRIQRSGVKKSSAPVTDDTVEIDGLLARLTQAYLRRRSKHLRETNLFRSSDSLDPSEVATVGGDEQIYDIDTARLEFIESPLQQMKRAGLGLLSQGLGTFGFGSSRVAAAASVPHPGEHSTLIIFVLGGISLNEVAQVQQQIKKVKSVLPASVGMEETRVILLSNRIVNGDMSLYNLLNMN